MLDFKVPLILASQSPRRRELFQMLGLPFSVAVSHLPEEVADGLPPEAIVRALAAQKAEDIAAAHQNALVIAADTMVALDGKLLGKPRDAEEAFSMLRQLNGRSHTVYTGIALCHRDLGRLITDFEATEVQFATSSDEALRAYLQTGLPLDKAGAYGIQDRGAYLIEGIRGDFFTVMGFPIRRFYVNIRQHFSDLLHN